MDISLNAWLSQADWRMGLKLGNLHIFLLLIEETTSPDLFGTQAAFART